jgi:hypothetical protein
MRGTQFDGGIPLVSVRLADGAERYGYLARAGMSRITPSEREARPEGTVGMSESGTNQTYENGVMRSA